MRRHRDRSGVGRPANRQAVGSAPMNRRTPPASSPPGRPARIQSPVTGRARQDPDDRASQIPSMSRRSRASLRPFLDGVAASHNGNDDRTPLTSDQTGLRRRPWCRRGARRRGGGSGRECLRELGLSAFRGWSRGAATEEWVLRLTPGRSGGDVLVRRLVVEPMLTGRTRDGLGAVAVKRSP